MTVTVKMKMIIEKLDLGQIVPIACQFSKVCMQHIKIVIIAIVIIIIIISAQLVKQTKKV